MIESLELAVTRLTPDKETTMTNKLFFILYLGMLMPLQAMEKEAAQTVLAPTAHALFIEQIVMKTSSLDEAVKKIREVPDISETLQCYPDVTQSIVFKLIEKFKAELQDMFPDVIPFIKRELSEKNSDEVYKFYAVAALGIPGALNWLKKYVEANKLGMQPGFLLAMAALGPLFKKGYIFKEENARLFYTVNNGGVPLRQDSPNRAYFAGKKGRCERESRHFASYSNKV